MKFFTNGQIHEYNGHPTPKKLREFIESKTGPLTTEITSDSVFNNLSSEELAIAYFGEDNDEEDFKIFEAAAAKHEDIKFYHSFDPKYYQLNNQVKVTMYFNGKKIDFLEPYGEEALQNWIVINR